MQTKNSNGNEIKFQRRLSRLFKADQSAMPLPYMVNFAKCIGTWLCCLQMHCLIRIKFDRGSAMFMLSL